MSYPSALSDLINYFRMTAQNNSDLYMQNADFKYFFKNTLKNKNYML